MVVSNGKKATRLEAEIYQEMHDLVNITDQTKITNALNVILIKLLAIVKSYKGSGVKDVKEGEKSYKIFVGIKNSIMKGNAKFRETTILDEDGWDLTDTNSGITIPVLPSYFTSQVSLFNQQQGRVINSKLSNLMSDVLSWLMDKELFNYDREVEGTGYTSYMSNGGNRDSPLRRREDEDNEF